MSTPLKSGPYNIRSFGQKLFIGRSTGEDGSHNPKPIISLPDGLPTQTWNIEALPNGAYILRIGGAPTGVLEKTVWVFLKGEQPTEWIIKPGKIPDAYFISTKDGQTWSLPTKAPGDLIPVGLVGVEEKNLLWRIIPLLKDTTNVLWN